MYRDKGAIRRRRIEQLNTRAQQKSERGQKRERRMICVKAAIRLKRNEKRTKQSAKHKNENSNTRRDQKTKNERTGKSIVPLPSASTSLIMSCNSASVGFWPRDRMTVPTRSQFLQRSVNAIYQKFFIVSEFDLAKNNFKISKGSFPSSYSRILPISLSLSLYLFLVRFESRNTLKKCQRSLALALKTGS